MVVVDPRRTGTVQHAGEWVPIQPGADAALLLAMVQVLFREGRVDPGSLAEHLNGLEAVERLLLRAGPGPSLLESRQSGQSSSVSTKEAAVPVRNTR